MKNCIFCAKIFVGAEKAAILNPAAVGCQKMHGGRGMRIHGKKTIMKAAAALLAAVLTAASFTAASIPVYAEETAVNDEAALNEGTSAESNNKNKKKSDKEKSDKKDKDKKEDKEKKEDSSETEPEKEEIVPVSFYMNPGWQWINGAWYFGNADYTVFTGWLKYKNRWYYLDPATGMMKTGWVLDQGIWYFLDSSGAMRTGWLPYGNSWYFLAANGAMLKGWVKYNNHWYYLDPETGAMRLGWVDVNGVRFFLDYSGKMLTGWILLGNTWYYLSDNGTMQTGWLYYKNHWYYLDPVNGDMKTGWQTIDNILYYFEPSGAMHEGWLEIDGVWYYLTRYGMTYTGLAPYNSDFYYVKDGVYDPSYNGKANIPGLSREFDVVNGYVCGGIVPPSEEVSKMARAVLDQTGWNIYAAYRYCILNWTTFTVGGEYGIAYYADYGFRAKTGNCYVMAAMFTALARELGYEAYQMSGYVADVSPHSWVEIRNKEDGRFYVCDPDLESEKGKGAFCFTYGTPGTWRYTSYYRMHN